MPNKRRRAADPLSAIGKKLDKITATIGQRDFDVKRVIARLVSLIEDLALCLITHEARFAEHECSMTQDQVRLLKLINRSRETEYGIIRRLNTLEK